MSEGDVRIRIHYGPGIEEADSTPLGVEGDGVELHRVRRPPLRPGAPERVDVVRLRPVEGGEAGEYEFVGSADPARRATTRVSLPWEGLDHPACDEFRRPLDEAGCVMEHDEHTAELMHLVFSHPPEAPVAAWHAETLRSSSGIDPAELPDHAARKARERERRRAGRRSRDRRVML